METATQPEDEARVAGVRARLADIVEADPSPAELALVGRLLTSFAAKTPAAADQLVRLLHQGDAAPVREQAHSLKGSAANIGATGLAQVCFSVEEQARAGIVADPGPTAERLAAEVDGAVRAVLILAGEYERASPA
ncbi:Hpt domain-containing protein [Actinoplanes sp. G11-F43]|uniref:Hpt domain-containing protein n=1 Tax=Actinoplanes sp. G11-F43 TaxID=3424130 RepID=UPI003D34B61A